jgi:hypothetical protein
MLPEVKNNILAVLEKVVVHLSSDEPDVSAIRELSDRTLEDLSIYQDESSSKVAVLTYAIAKLLERSVEGKDKSSIRSALKKAEVALTSGNDKSFAAAIQKGIKLISSLDEQCIPFIQEVVRAAQIKKSGKLYSRGISSAQAAKVLGVSRWEVCSYVGAVGLSERDPDISSVRNRLAFARTLFK